MPQISDVCDLKSYHFHDLPIIYKWENIEMFLIFKILIGSTWDLGGDHNN